MTLDWYLARLQFSGYLSLTPLIIVSLWKIRKADMEVFVERIQALVWSVRREPGCLFFDLYRVVSIDDLVAFHEVWTTPDARRLHLEGPLALQLRELQMQLTHDAVRSIEVEEIV